VPAPPPPGFVAHPRLTGTDIELTTTAAASAVLTPDLIAALGAAGEGLARRWPTGHELVSMLVRRIQIDPDPGLNSKSVSELPGCVILGGHVHDPVGIAELLVHEAMHLLVYEMARLEAILPEPATPRHSPYSRAESRPAYMVLHGAASFLAQTIATARLQDDRAVVTAAIARECERLAAAEGELRAHLGTHGAAPHPFVEAVFGEMAALRRAAR
jgi:HEXXH motif-containing protein